MLLLTHVGPHACGVLTHPHLARRGRRRRPRAETTIDRSEEGAPPIYAGSKGVAEVLRKRVRMRPPCLPAHHTRGWAERAPLPCVPCLSRNDGRSPPPAPRRQGADIVANIHGHTHEASGHVEVNGVPVINPGALVYVASRSPTVLQSPSPFLVTIPRAPPTSHRRCSPPPSAATAGTGWSS